MEKIQWQRCYSLFQIEKKKHFPSRAIFVRQQLQHTHARARLLNILLLHYYCTLLLS